MKIAIIGVGNLGYSIAVGILGQKKEIGCKSLYLTKRNTSSLNHFDKVSLIKTTTDNRRAVKYSDVIILAVQPTQLMEVLKEIRDLIDPKKHIIISVATGRKISDIEALLPQGVPVIRCMPNTAISVGQSMTCISANEVAQANVHKAKSIFNALGETMCIEESLMQAATVICASGIAFWMRLIRATTQGAVQLGFHSEEAQKLSMQTCLGAASLLIDSQSHPEQEIDKVTTPSGCTIEGLNEMEHQGLSSSIIKGLVTSYEKINQI
ncbi:pyrroline-5-carboxylate reductase [Lutimonas saemankumensis]|uniref:pyrroline-5-carboxylate reductase n=1 Tax=Lutimonas saemankumensis TaxID=483016 RepID=UPI001CD2EB21|nr:pyrroline-5-carboxylate reductase [Lutimonas saemankumensis]MCA0933469.1 pyrroline-5-carboxylate reductase [Lutimonas saemankumensis]